MTMMQPDPSAEFREEKEFRAKVYHMLSLGLSTTEIEGLLQKRVNWSLFSEETIKDMIESSRVNVISIPPELTEALSDVLKSSTEISKENLDAVSTAFSNLNAIYEGILADIKRQYSRIIRLVFIAWFVFMLITWGILK